MAEALTKVPFYPHYFSVCLWHAYLHFIVLTRMRYMTQLFQLLRTQVFVSDRAFRWVLGRSRGAINRQCKHLGSFPQDGRASNAHGNKVHPQFNLVPCPRAFRHVCFNFVCEPERSIVSCANRCILSASLQSKVCIIVDSDYCAVCCTFLATRI